MYLMILKVVTLFQLMACNQNLENDSNPPHEVAQDGIFEITQLTSGLVSPWGMTFLPDQSILIGSRTTAQIHRINEMEATSQLVGTVPNVSFTAEGGLLGLEVSPKFEEDRLIYAYTSSSPSNRIVSLKIAEDFRSLQVIDTLLEGITTANRHHGGRLLIDSNDCMWITTGDAFQPDLAQDLQSLNGKILRIRLDGSFPEGNIGNSPVFSYGHRNVQGVTMDPAGRVFASELGHRTWDEVNQILSGTNYGWPIAEGIQGNFGHAPLLVIHPDDCSPSGIVYFKKALWMGALGGQGIYQIPLNEDGAVGIPVMHLNEVYGRIRTIQVAPDKSSLLVLTSNTDQATWGGTSTRLGDDRLLRIRVRD